MPVFDVTYACTRSEVYRVTARNADYARDIAFEQGEEIAAGGETCNVEPIDCARVPATEARAARKPKTPLPRWTVIGTYDDTGQVFVVVRAAKDAFAAMAACAAWARQEGLGSNLQIVGAVRGVHALTAPCDDTGKTAFADDL